MATLFDIKAEFAELYQMATDEDINAEVLADTIEGLMGELEVKAGGYIAVINQLDMEAKKAKELAEEFKRKADIRINSIANMKNALKITMEQIGLDKIEADPFTIKLQKNGGKQPMLIDGDVPNDYMKVVYEVDREKIRKDLEDGKELKFAHLEERGKHVVIK